MLYFRQANNFGFNQINAQKSSKKNQEKYDKLRYTQLDKQANNQNTPTTIKIEVELYPFYSDHVDIYRSKVLLTIRRKILAISRIYSINKFERKGEKHKQNKTLFKNIGDHLHEGIAHGVPPTINIQK